METDNFQSLDMCKNKLLVEKEAYFRDAVEVMLFTHARQCLGEDLSSAVEKISHQLSQLLKLLPLALLRERGERRLCVCTVQ